MKKVLNFFAGVIFSLFAAQAVSASSIDALVNKLESKGVITKDEAAQIIAQAKTEKNATPAWIEKLTFSGDMRLRTQIDTINGAHPRVRERVRLRFGIETAAAENIKMGFRLASGEMSNNADRNPTSANHTFGAFNKIPVMIDLAYLEYAPAKWATLTGGKVKSGTQIWNASQIIWKNDVNPDGIALRLKSKKNKFNLFANAGWYTLGEAPGTSGADADNGWRGMPSIVIAQPGATYTEGNLQIKAALAYQQFYTRGKTIPTNSPNNWLWATGANDYQLINPSIEIKQKNAALRYTAAAHLDFSRNVDGGLDTTRDRNAYLAGIMFGDERINTTGHWHARIAYSRLEQYAMPRGMSDTDAYEGKPSQGWQYVLSLGLVKNFWFTAKYYDMIPLEGAAPSPGFATAKAQQVWQLDLNYRF